jgi:predicted acyltransferase
MSNSELAPSLKQRLDALDIFRGLTLIAMIIVNSPGTYGQLSHAYWEGLTIADFIFPFFLFIVGVAIALNLKRLPETAAQRNAFYTKVIKRTAILFALGLLVNLFYTHFAQIRVAGVLQRIALVYCACCILTVHFRTTQLIWISALLLVGYWAMLLFIPAPGIAAGTLERGNNLANWLDLQFLPGMLWRGTWDPEGIISTLPAIVTGLIGVFVGKIVLRNEGLPERISAIFALGLCVFLLGYVWSFFFPFIKQIWTSSFALATAGAGALLLALLLWLIDYKGMQRFTFVARVFGTNAIFAYVFHVALEKLLTYEIAGASVYSWVIDTLKGVGLSADAASFLWISAFLALCFAPIYIMYKKGIFLKI